MLGAALSMAAVVAASAHEVQPSVADVTVTADRVTVELVTAVEPMIAGMDLGDLGNTNESPLADVHDGLRALDPDSLADALVEAWPTIAARIVLRAGEVDLTPELAEVSVPPVGDIEFRRDSTLTITAPLPDDDAPVILGWDAALGGLIVRQVSESTEGGYDVFLTSGDLTEPMPRTGAAEQSVADAINRYVFSGFDHIVPKGLDHILFVLGLFFYSLAFRPLLWQVTAFTAAHTVTLALATLGIVTIPDRSMWIVETIIAASIVYVAVENIWSGPRTHITMDRIAVVFGFGLLHGLGFASVLSEFGLDQHFVVSLISFNVGVEIGQLAVIAVAFLLLGLPFGRRPWYRRAIVIPGSLVIAAIGSYWVLNRIGWVGDVPLLT